MYSFSSKQRENLIKQLQQEQFDLLIIGGGITGAGIALDAASRGLKTAVIEMQDFASGTSGRSTKLIHGGLRYLKQLEFKLVAEVGKEREIIHTNAPHLTKPEQMLLPITKNGSLGKTSTCIAMWLYELLAGVKKEERSIFLSKDNTLKVEPIIKQNDLLGSILFYEYRTDDARLTIEVMKEAVSRGVIAINYIKCVSFVYEKNKVCGVMAENCFGKEQFNIKANYVVNAGGPWVDRLNALDNKKSETKLHITKGIHLVVSHEKLPVKQSAYFDTHDKRMVFVIPRDEKTYIGTTDTFYEGNLENPEITKQDRDYLLKCVNAFFPQNTITSKDIESGWAGLRPLVNKPGKGPSEISRKDEVFISDSGLITIAGGKLTGYRKMAKRITDIVAEKYLNDKRIKLPKCTTHIINISGREINKWKDFSEFMQNKIKEGLNLGLEKIEVKKLIFRYGSNINEIFSLIKTLTENEKHELPVTLRAELLYVIEKEMCVSPSDFFIRRTGILYFNIEVIKKWGNSLSDYMKNKMSWDDEQSKLFSAELQKAIDKVENIKNL